jgi:hypothetical protein
LPLVGSPPKLGIKNVFLYMASNTQHVVPNPSGGWSVKRGGATRATKTFDNQKDAIIFARQVSLNQGSELYVHKRDGTILRKDSFATDSNPSTDKK